MSEILEEAYQILTAHKAILVRNTHNGRLIGLEMFCPAIKIHGMVYKFLNLLIHLGPDLRIDQNTNEEKIYISMVIRTIGFFQPFCSLMLHGKKETRWVREGKKPPFPAGKYLLYTTKSACDMQRLNDWCGPELRHLIAETLRGEKTRNLNGYAIAIADFSGEFSIMTSDDERECFVKFKGVEYREDKDRVLHPYLQNVLPFTNVQRIEPFEFNWGKQGVGILPITEHHKIKLL